MCCMTGQVSGALPADATRSGANEFPWWPTQVPVPYISWRHHNLHVCCRRAP